MPYLGCGIFVLAGWCEGIMGKKQKSREGGIVYSTGPSPIDWSGEKPDLASKSGHPSSVNNSSIKGQTESSGPREAVLRMERSGRKGKTVTVIELRGIGVHEANEIGKRLKSGCGVGGTTRGTIVELQGDQRERVKPLLEKEELRVRG